MKAWSPAQSWERWRGENVRGEPAHVEALCFNAFLDGATSFAEGLAAILELEPATPLELDLAADLRRMVELARRG